MNWRRISSALFQATGHAGLAIGRLVVALYVAGTELSTLSGAREAPLRLRWGASARQSKRVGGRIDPSAVPLSRALQAARRRLWLARSAILVLRIALLLAVVAFAWTIARYFRVQSVEAILAPVGVGVALLGLVFAFLQHVSDLDAARVLDRQLGLRARLGTAVQLLASGTEGGLAQSQLQQAIKVVQTSRPERRVGLPFPRSDLRRLGAIVVATSLVLVLSAFGAPNAASQAAAGSGVPNPQTDSWTEVAAETMDDLPTGAVDPAITRQLDELRQQLESGKITPQEYAAQAAALEQALNERAVESASQQEALTKLAEALKDSSATRPISDSLNRGDYAGAVQQTNALANQASQLSSQARQEIAKSLSQAAQSTSQQSPGLSKAAQAASDSMSSGQPSDAQQGLNDLASAMSDAAQSVVPQSDMAEAIRQAAAASDGSNGADQSQLADSGSPNQAGSQSGSGSQPGDQNQESGNPGQGQTNQDANSGTNSGGGAGSGAGQRTTSRSPDQSTQAGSDNVLRIDGKPTQLGQASRSDSQNTPRTSISSGTTTVTSTGSFQRSSDPVTAVGEQNSVPVELKPVVKDYFSGDPSSH